MYTSDKISRSKKVVPTLFETVTEANKELTQKLVSIKKVDYRFCNFKKGVKKLQKFKKIPDKKNS